MNIKTIKKLLISLLLIVIIGLGVLKILSEVTHIEWGHYFSFKNELNIEIDSLEITIGDIKTIVLAEPDDLRNLEGNINVPKKGYPHIVSFKIFSNEKSIILKADSFDCYNCDGSHQYTLKQSGAKYHFLN